MQVTTRLKGIRCFKRGNVYWIEIKGRRSSLKTKDPTVAQLAVNELERRIEAGEQVEYRKLLGKATLGDFKTQYLKARENTISTKTYKMDVTSLRQLVEVFGEHFKLRELSNEKIEQFKAKLLYRGASPTTVNSYLRHIKAALGVAVEWGYIKRRPKIKFLPAPEPLPRVLEKSEIEKLKSKAKKNNPDFYPILVFLLYTGTRRNEALSLKWENVVLKGDRPRAKITGKGNKERIVPLLPPVVDVLNELKAKNGQRVFVEVHPDTLTHWFRDLAKECGIKARLHDIRHTATTYMLASGIDLPVVQKILGHSAISTTQIYAKVVEEQIHKQMKKLKFDF